MSRNFGIRRESDWFEEKGASTLSIKSWSAGILKWNVKQERQFLTSGIATKKSPVVGEGDDVLRVNRLIRTYKNQKERSGSISSRSDYISLPFFALFVLPLRPNALLCVLCVSAVRFFWVWGLEWNFEFSFMAPDRPRGG